MGNRKVADEPSLVRPYTLTAGRTDTRVHLPLEAPIGTLAFGEAPAVAGKRCAGPDPDTVRRSPVGRRDRRRLALPLGVARVLIGDLVTQGYLRVHTTLGESATNDERRELIGRTLRGLRAL